MSETATILFTDVEGSTNLRTRLGDAEANRILAESERAVRAAVETHGGVVVKQLGDGVMATFDSARGAVMAAVAVQAPGASDGLRVRVGVHAGEVERANGDLQGAAVHAAARIMASAAGGEVLISESARELAGLFPEGTRVVDRGLFWLKGFPERWRLFEVLGEGRQDAPVVTAEGATPYVGRAEEVADLRRALAEADGGRGSVVMIGGEPGVGKTRLAEEAAAHARRRGMLVFTGRCSDIEGAPPYLPFVEILEAVAAFVPRDALRAALGDTAGEVARVMPELRRMFPDLPPPVELPPEQERRYLLNAIRDVVTRAARWHALVLILDDLHWADEPSLLLLEHLAEVLPETPCLVLGTYRDVELEVGRPLARTLEGLVRRKLADRMSLRRLTESAVRDLLAAMAGQDPPDSLVRIVFSETEGNPFFVEEVFRHLSEEGRLFDESGAYREDLVVSEIDVPEGVRLVIGRRLERLSEPTRDALAAGAVLGRVFSFRTMAAVADRGAEDLLDALDEAERAHLLAPAGGGADERYAFSHELVRQTLLAGVTSSRRRRLHLRAADAIESVYGEAANVHAGDVAHHLLAAGAAAEPARTVRWLRIAGDRALNAAAFEDAVRHFDAALSLDAGTDERDRAELRFGLGSAQRGAVRWEEALETWNESLRGFDSLGDDERVADVAWHIGYQLLWAGRRDELAILLGDVLGRLEGTNSAGHARLLQGGAAGFASVGQLAPALMLLEKSAAMVEVLDDEAALWDLEQARSFVHWAFPGLPESIAHGRRAAELMEAGGALWDLANVKGFVCSSEALAGNDEEARRWGAEASVLADRFGHVGAHIYVNRALAPLDVNRSGDIAGFRELMRAESDLGREAGIAWADMNARWYMALADLWLGETDPALELAAASVPDEVPATFRGWGLGVHALILAHASRTDALVTLMDGHRDDLPKPGETASSGAWMLGLFAVEALAVAGEWDRVAELAPIVDAVTATGMVRRVIDCRSVDAIRGLAAAGRGDARAAQAAFEDALLMADERELRIEAAEVRRLFALALDRLGVQADRAKELWADAYARYRDLGMNRFAELCEA